MTIKIRGYKRGGFEVDIRFTYPDGVPFRRRYRAPVESKSAAKRWGEAREAELLIENYARANRQKASGIDSKKSILKHHLYAQLGERKLDAIDDESVQHLKAALAEKSPKTVNNVLTVLNKLLKFAVKWKVIDRVPCTIELLKVHNLVPKFYEFAEYERLVEAARKISSRSALVVLLGGDAGLRRGEMIGLRWCDVDLRRRQLAIQQSVWKGIVDSPKSGRGRITFGRIGTDGQTQVKSFASSDAAENELAKLVKEKLKKGYAEVGGAPTNGVPVASPAKAKSKKATPTTNASPPSAAAELPSNGAATPAQPTAAATTAPNDAVSPKPSVPRRGCVAWTDAGLRAASPIRGSELVPIRMPDVKATYAKLAKAMQGCAPILDAGTSHPGANKALMKQAREIFSGALPERLELETQAAAFALIAPKVSWNDNPRDEAFVHLWFAKEGAAFALRAFVRGMALSWQCEASDRFIALIGHKPDKENVQWWRLRELLGWRGLRFVAAVANDMEHAALIAEAESLARDSSVEVRAALAAAFEHPEWCDADIGSGNEPENWFWPLIVSSPTLILALRFFPADAMHLVRRTLRSSTPICVEEIAALLAAIDQPWCVRELAAALKDSPRQSAIAAALRRSASDVARRRAAELYVSPFDGPSIRGGFWDNMFHAHAGASFD
jgi:hypothetical protein